MEFLVTLCATWAPSLTAIVSVIVVVLTAIAKTKAAFTEFKADNTLKDVKDQLERALSDNAEIKRQNNILIEQITKVKGFADKET